LVGVKGIGLTTGETYIAASAGGASETLVNSGQLNVGTVDMNLIIGRGNTPDSTGFVRVHFVVTAEGEVKVEHVAFHAGCRGG
jgi:hypothetical protein